MPGPVSRERVPECTANFEPRDGVIVDYVAKGPPKVQNEQQSGSRVFGRPIEHDRLSWPASGPPRGTV